ncbi:hypothetical protein TNIN_100721, partial [Trichonephila inaurata madagascariensis]
HGERIGCPRTGGVRRDCRGTPRPYGSKGLRGLPEDTGRALRSPQPLQEVTHLANRRSVPHNS